MSRLNLTSALFARRQLDFTGTAPRLDTYLRAVTDASQRIGYLLPLVR